MVTVSDTIPRPQASWQPGGNPTCWCGRAPIILQRRRHLQALAVAYAVYLGMHKSVLKVLMAAFCLAAWTTPAQPITASNAPPVATAVEEVYNLSLVVQKVNAHVEAGQLAAVLDYYYVYMKAVQFLLARTNLARPGKEVELKQALMDISGKLNAVRNAAMNRGQPEASAAVKELNEARKRVKDLYPLEFLAAVSDLSSRFICPAHTDVIGRQRERCSRCGRSLQKMDQFCGLPSSDPVVKASARPPGPLMPGQKAEVVLQLTRKDGAPVRENDLLPTHLQRMHFFAIDSTLLDYHHEHPAATANAGEYALSFTPRNAGGYRVWLDLLPAATRREEMPSLDLGHFRALPFDRNVSDTFTNASWQFKLKIDQAPLRAGFPGWARLTVTDLAGSPCTRLEPIMANFAHFAGFHEDGKTMYHLHAAGLKDIVDPTLRSGPEVELYLPGLKAGFVRLFAQVQIDGQVITAPFGISVEP